MSSLLDTLPKDVYDMIKEYANTLRIFKLKDNALTEISTTTEKTVDVTFMKSINFNLKYPGNLNLLFFVSGKKLYAVTKYNIDNLKSNKILNEDIEGIMDIVVEDDGSEGRFFVITEHRIYKLICIFVDYDEIIIKLSDGILILVMLKNLEILYIQMIIYILSMMI